ncbi:hypothetical protein HZB60_11325 [candidate division KSB1 bacterium]|nr:hypothetical protein [candidate division KSB1 bacterium]
MPTALTSYSPQYKNPISSVRGDVFRLGQRDDEYPGWIWTTAADGRSGWTHESFLSIDGERATLLEAYTAQELTIRVGDLLEILREVGGWYWCRTANNDLGWLPSSILVP